MDHDGFEQLYRATDQGTAEAAAPGAATEE